MSHRVIENIRKGLRLVDGVKELELEHCCVEACILAAGGEGMDIWQVERRDMGWGLNKRMFDYFERFGLVPGPSLKLEDEVSPESLEYYFTNEKVNNEENHYYYSDRFVGKIGRTVGYFCSYLKDGQEVESHVFLLFRREVLPRDLRKVLKAKGDYLTFETMAARGIAITNAEIMASDFNEMLGQGYKFEFFPIAELNGKSSS